jgi:hypothetical protein
MSGGIVNRVTNTLSLLILISIRVSSQDGTHPVRLLFYNTENLFDCIDDTLTQDEEFLPQSTHRWNFKRYSAKINSIGKVILAAGEFTPPAIISLCEIENRKVLEDLIYSPALAKINFGIVHEDSPDERGIDVCILYRKDIATLISYRYIIPFDCSREDFKTRSVLHAVFKIDNDTIHVFANHWPSRRGGVLAGESMRSLVASMVRKAIDSLALKSSGHIYVIVGGDLNSTPEDLNARLLIQNYSSGIEMINLSANLPVKSGTYKYRGSWEMIDQVFVSSAMISSGLCDPYKSLQIFSPDFLLQKDPAYTGQRPFPTYLGYKYMGGFSDHLPVMLTLYFP